VVFAVFRQNARPVGSTGEVQMRQAAAIRWVEAVVVTLMLYPDIDQGRAAAERLAESTG
jgi:hypothetical protein